uniref:DH domain-containing protein n=1 Tax=Parascaris univalens TaxID=6257 RepID=A0A915AZA4_PARUN
DFLERLQRISCRRLMRIIESLKDIERMKSSAAVIAQSLSEFGRCLKETELPNDVETTARILEIQTAERDAIKEDFRISIRKGLSLLRHVRQLDVKPEHEQLSPTRLHNVTAIERMLIQLEETERSFDTFWARHEKRLTQCLQLRRFEESFRKLQSSFAKHMIYLEEHREVGDGVVKAEQLAQTHADYAKHAMEDVQVARALRDTGQELISTQDVELAGSLLPKCDELARMADALTGALDRRSQVLTLSKDMHEQIVAANKWCKRGVDLLTAVPLDVSPTSAAVALTNMDDFIADGQCLKLDALSQSPTMNNLILLTTTETSTLLAQVAERIDDIRRMSAARRDALQKLAGRENRKPPVQVVSPEKLQRRSSNSSNASPAKRQIEVLHEFHSQTSEGPSCEGTDIIVETPTAERSSIANFVIAELVNTEQTYVRELQSIIDYYVKPFEAPENSTLIPSPLRDRSDIVFGNLRELLEFHDHFLLADFLRAADSVIDICHCFVSHRNRFLQLYHPYCQNKPLSEALRREHVDGCKFFAECQKRAGHPLPLSAYLLKPVQRITKYQLLLKELHRHCAEEARHDVEAALSSMLDLLAQLNSAMHQLHISGFAGDLTLLGPLRLQTECDIFAFKKKARRLNKAQRRHLFLFDGGVLFCKKRTQPVPYAPEYYEHKLCIPTCSLGFADSSKTSPSRFEIWDETKSEAYAVQPLDESSKVRWIQRLHRITGEFLSERGSHRAQRPQSWASTVSNESTASARSSSGETTTSADSSLIDPNGNQSLVCSSSPVSSLPIVPSSEKCMEARQPSDCDNNLTPSADVHKSRAASSIEEPLDASATPPLNAIVESASQSELLAAI